MRKYVALMLMTLCLAPVSNAWADRFQDTIRIFKNAGESSGFFERSYAYAVFPTVGRGGIGIGGAHGSGRVYVDDKHVGDSSMTQVTVGFQLGGKVYSMIVFLEDERAFQEFTSGSFEFSARTQAVAITAGASATASTAGSSAGASGGRNDATTVGGFHRGMAVFTVATGGLMYEASLGGARFSYSPL